MVAEIINGQLVLCRSLIEALALTDTEVPRIAAVGAGGKTSILKRLAEEYRKMGRRSVVTTTTHMRKETSPLFLENPVLDEILNVLNREGTVFAGGKAEGGKIKMLPQNVLGAVLKLPDPVLIEADGARMLPVKVPGEHEPVLLPQITCVLSVYGLDACGGRIKDVCFRPELTAKLLCKAPIDVLEPRDIAILAQSTLAGRKGVQKDMQYAVILNKADTEERCETAVSIWKAMEYKQDMKVIVTARQEEG